MRTNKLLTIIWQGFMGLAALVGFIFLGFLGPDFSDVGGFLFLFGIICVLLTSFSWARIIEEYNYSSRKEKAFTVLHYPNSHRNRKFRCSNFHLYTCTQNGLLTCPSKSKRNYKRI